MSSTTSEMTPTLWPGVTWVKGKPKPVTLVSTVVNRNSAVQPLGRLAESIPNTTMSPDPMPTRLMMTCTVVNVERDMPSIMLKVLSKQGSDITTRWGDFYRGEFALAG